MKRKVNLASAIGILRAAAGFAIDAVQSALAEKEQEELIDEKVEELGKKNEIGCIQDEGPEEVFLCGVASLFLSPDVSQDTDSGSYKHLQDLQAGDEHGKPAGGLHFGSLQSVVGVHDGMYTKVHGHEPAACSHLVLVSKARVHQHCAVVVPVHKDEWPLTQDDEGRVSWEMRSHS